MNTKALVVVSIILSSVPSCKSTSHPPRGPEMFGGLHCETQQRGWTGEELRDLAFRYAGHAEIPPDTTVRYWQQGCEIEVFVNLNVLQAGSRFVIVVSSTDGSLVRIVPGE
jgi:hypothetical protein